MTQAKNLLSTTKTLFVIFVLSSHCVQSAESLSPIAFLPGFTGSQIDVKLQFPQLSFSSYFYCPRTTFGRFITVWFAPWLLLFPRCPTRFLTLEIDESASEALAQETGNPDAVVQRNLNGVTTRTAASFALGEISVGYPSWLLDFGYEPGVNVVDVPFDWRYNLLDLKSSGIFDEIQSIVETLYTTNNNTKVTIMGHSQGGLVSLNFLQSMTQAWKDQYVSSFVSMATPYAGFVRSNEYFTSGTYSLFDAIPILVGGQIPLFGDLLVNPVDALLTFYERLLFRPFFASLGALTDFLPQPDAFGSSLIFIETPSKSYSPSNISELFTDLGLADQLRLYMYRKSDPTTILEPPMVNTYIIYGCNLSTIKKSIFNEDFQPGRVPLGSSAAVFGDGDGIVNIESLSYADDKWADSHNASGFQTNVSRLAGTEHLDILFTTDAKSLVMDILDV